MRTKSVPDGHGPPSTPGRSEPANDPTPDASTRWRNGGRVPTGLVVVVATAFALRLGWLLYAGHEPSVLSDALAYMRYGRDIAAGRGYTIIGLFLGRSNRPTAYHPIGYPGILGGLFWVGARVGLHDEARLAGLLNVVLGTATVGLVYGIARRLFDHGVALVAAWVVALWPNLVFYTSSIMSETTFAFTIALAVWVAVAAPWPEGLTWRRAAAFGCVVGASILIRPFSAVLIVVAAAAMLAGRIGWQRTLRFTGTAAVLAAVVVAPWTIRNAVRMHSFVPVATNVGDLLCIDNSDGANGGLRLVKRCPVSAAPKATGEAEVRANNRNTNAALVWAVEHPLSELWLLPQRLALGYADDYDGLTEAQLQRQRDPPLSSASYHQVIGAADAYFFAALAFGLWGLGWFFSRSRPRRLFVAFAALAVAATPLYTYGLPRFHVPALPLIAVLTAPALTAMARALRNARSEVAEPVPPSATAS